MKRRPMSKRSSRAVFRKGSRVHKKNGLAGVNMVGIMRGGIRL